MARTTIASPGFLDRLGDRVVVTDRTGGDLEVLRLRPELTADAAFEPSLKARAEQLVAFQHRGAARVRGISRLPGADGRLAIVSDVAKGWRLSEVLQAAEHEGRLIHTSTVLFLLRQVASVVTALQACGPEMAHGSLGPERVVLSPAGRVLVVEYVLGAALEHLPALPADRMWKEYRLAVAADANGLRFGQHTDVLQLGIIALSLVHNRLLKRDEYPTRLTDLLDTATESQVTGARQPLGRVLRDWLEHALGLAPGAARWTMADAQRGLDWIVSAEGGYFSTPVGLEPLLQSVERFFTVPPADAATAARDVPQAFEPQAEVVPPALHPDPPPSMTVRVRPREDARTEPAAPSPAPAAHDEHRAPAAPVLTLVRSEAEACVALPPATEFIARTLEAENGPAGTARGDEGGSAESLIVMSSPLAEFAAEHVADPFPAPPDLVTEPAASRPSLWPVLPTRPSASGEPVDGPPGVAPVADMLSVPRDRPAGRRRSGWNDEAWQSRSTERQPSGARTIAGKSGPVESHSGGSGAARAATTTRVSRAGGAATATAAALRPNESVPAHDVVTSPDPSPSPFGEHQAAPGVQALQAIEPVHPASEPPAVPEMPRRPMFGFSTDAAEHEAPGTEERPRARRRNNMLWPAVAALVILCGGGFAAWKFLRPTAPAAATAGAPADSNRKTGGPTRSETKAPATAATPVPQPASAAPASAPVAAAAPEAKPVTGSLRLVSPFVVSVSEKGAALGTSAAPIALSAGPHVLDLVSEEFGYHATRPVEIRAGRVTRTELALPNGSVNINATPWAEVLVDGQKIGETPLGNVQLTIGPHEVRFRHPQLGEQVRTVMITTGTPGRLSVDMKQ